jgi:hypothetical protein
MGKRHLGIGLEHRLQPVTGIAGEMGESVNGPVQRGNRFAQLTGPSYRPSIFATARSGAARLTIHCRKAGKLLSADFRSPFPACPMKDEFTRVNSP